MVKCEVTQPPVFRVGINHVETSAEVTSTGGLVRESPQMVVKDL